MGGYQADNGTFDSGAAYLFARAGGGWSQQTYVKASNTGASDAFGYDVSLSGDPVAIGARQERSSATGVNGDQSDDGANSSGAAYVIR